MATVYNVIGSGDHDPPGNNSTWKQWWENNSRYAWPNNCQSGGCGYAATEGAHVAEQQNVRFGSNTTIYIAPFCKDHNEKPTDFGHTVPDDYLTAP